MDPEASAGTWLMPEIEALFGAKLTRQINQLCRAADTTQVEHY
jgi:hypothetical protein